MNNRLLQVLVLVGLMLSQTGSAEGVAAWMKSMKKAPKKSARKAAPAQVAIAPVTAPAVEARISPPAPSKVGLVLEGGLSLGSLSLQQMSSQISSSSNYRTGLAGGVGLDFSLSEHFSIQPEVLFVQKGGNFTTGDLSSNGLSKYDVIEIPVLLKGKIGSDKARAVIFAGPSASYVISKNIGSVTTADVGTNDEIAKFDIGAHFGAGGEFAVSESTSLVVTGRYYKGLLNLSRGNIYKVSMDGMLFMTGLKIGL